MADESLGRSPARPAPPNHIVIPADLGRLGEVRSWVRARAERAGFSAQHLGDIDLAVTEAVSNVVRHAYHEDVRELVTVRACLDGSRFVVSIFDTGPPFLGAVAAPDLDVPQVGGYGLHLISAVMDDATWRRLPDGRNELRLELHVNRSARD